MRFWFPMFLNVVPFLLKIRNTAKFSIRVFFLYFSLLNWVVMFDKLSVSETFRLVPWTSSYIFDTLLGLKMGFFFVARVTFYRNHILVFHLYLLNGLWILGAAQNFFFYILRKDNIVDYLWLSLYLIFM